MERLEETTEQPGALKVKLGETFFPFPPTFQPDRIPTREEYGMWPILVRRIELEGVGAGEVRLVRDDYLEEMLTMTSLRTPAGPVEFRLKMDNDVPEIVSASAPLCAEVNFQLTEEEAKKIKARLLFRGITYEGERDIDEPGKEDEGFLVMFFNWGDTQKNEGCHTLYFPPDPQVLSQIGFVFSRA